MNVIYTGVVENRIDPLKLGRCQVRVHGLHTHDKAKIKTEDLPWAYPIQPLTSAAMSGIGHSPLGPVEGTVVVVTFRDDDEQMPIILGTLGGIPQKDGAIDRDTDGMILKQDGAIPAGDAEPVTTNDGSTATSTSTPEVIKDDIPLKPAKQYSVSQDAINLLKQFEGLKLTAYQDSVGIWTIGYGTTRIEGQPVQPGMTITQAQADQYLLQYVNETAVPAVQRNSKALITQSMFDAMCCITYNIGQGNYAKSTLVKQLNVEKYLESANEFMAWNKAGGKELAGLTRRRQAEKTLFLKDGIPSATGGTQPVQSEQTPVGEVAPATSAPSSGIPDSGLAMSLGFRDPKGKYPLYLNEPDTNRLARHEEIHKTIVRKKEVARYKGVVTAQGKTWNQSPIPYNADYPFNHVFQSESGHVLEFDDTPNSERIHMYHKSGTFTETDSNGTQVNRIVGDKFEILERNGYVYIKGTANVTIDGDHNVKINNALNVDVSGKTTINVFNNADVNVSGDMNLSVKENLNVRAKTIQMEAYGGDINIKASGNFNYDAAIVFAQSGASKPAGLSTPIDAETPELPEFTELVVLTRGARAAANYDTPEDGNPAEYIKKRIEEGTLDEEDKPEEKESASAKPNSVPPKGANCDLIYNMDKFTASLQLSKHFTLGALTSNGTRMPVNQQGLTAQEIVCNLKGLAENCLEPIIELYPSMIISSGFRRPGDVAASSKTSQHYLGQAADIQIPGYSRQQMYEAVQKIQQLVPYDQLLLEYSGSTTCWIHVSFKYEGNRKQNFTMLDHSRVSDFGVYKLIA